MLTEAAWAASRTKGTFFKERYGRLAARRGGKKALLAVGHSILKAIHYMLSTGARFHDLGEMYVPERTEKKRRDYLRTELKKLGYEVALTKKRKISLIPINWARQSTGRFLLEHPESDYETGPNC